MTLTFDLMTFNVLVHWLSHDQTMYQILEKLTICAAELPEAFFMHCSAQSHLGLSSFLLDPLSEFKLLTPSALAVDT